MCSCKQRGKVETVIEAEEMGGTPQATSGAGPRWGELSRAFCRSPKESIETWNDGRGCVCGWHLDGLWRTPSTAVRPSEVRNRHTKARQGVLSSVNHCPRADDNYDSRFLWWVWLAIVPIDTTRH